MNPELYPWSRYHEHYKYLGLARRLVEFSQGLPVAQSETPKPDADKRKAMLLEFKSITRYDAPVLSQPCSGHGPL
jgi:hypothetical protein